MKLTTLSLALAALAAPATASGAPGGDLINRPEACAPGEMPVSLAPDACGPYGPSHPGLPVDL